MAGEGSRFKLAGFERPKPLIEVNSKPMIELVVDNLRPNSRHRFIFICREEHEQQFRVSEILESISPGCEVLFTLGLTEGAASTVLIAEQLIDNQEPLLIANSDQYIDFEIDNFLTRINSNVSGSIMTMLAQGDKWSYVSKNSDGSVENVVEKVQVSDEATVGIYYFKHGADFVKSAREMIAAEEKANGEYYVAPVYNKMINKGLEVEAISVGAIESEIFGLGTPKDLEIFLERGI